jgi:hypothetical protein
MRESVQGTRNFPISIGQVLGWRKMRGFRPRTLVIAALKKSTFLEVIEDKLIRRRTPWDGRYTPAPSEERFALGKPYWHDDDFPIILSYKDKGKMEESNSEPERDELAPPPGYKYDKNCALVRISAINVSGSNLA